MKQNMVLLVDDDPMSNTYSSIVVKKQNPATTLISFTCGAEALDYLKNAANEMPDFIFLDLNMPVMNGWDFMEEFEKLKLHIKVVVVTSSNETVDIEKSQTFKGITDYFVKPITVENISNLFAVVSK